MTWMSEQGGFTEAFNHIIGAEGGYVNDLKDPGGETKYGISKRAYPDLDIASLTIDDAEAIYRRDYWNAISGDSLPWPLALFMFDCAVNQGVSVAKHLLQHSIGVKVDGIIGPATIEAAHKMGQEGLALFMADRALHYAETRNFDDYGRGWLKRLFVLIMEA